MVLVPDGHKSMPKIIAHSNNNRHSVSHFPYKHTVTCDTSTWINTLSDCFPEKNSNIRCRISDDQLSVYHAGVAALFTGLTVQTTPSLHVLHMYLMHYCINCLQWCYMASEHHIAPLNIKQKFVSRLAVAQACILRTLNLYQAYSLLYNIATKQGKLFMIRTIDTQPGTYSFKSRYGCLVNSPYIALLMNAANTHRNYQDHTICFPNKPSDELFPCVYFVAYSYLLGCCPHNNLAPNICIITLACQVPSFWPCKQCCAVIKLQAEQRILWISCRIFTWFTRTFLSSLNNNCYQHSY